MTVKDLKKIIEKLPDDTELAPIKVFRDGKEVLSATLISDMMSITVGQEPFVLHLYATEHKEQANVG